jgi:secernin
VVFGKNSDRPCGEGQSIRCYPAADYNLNNQPVVSCTYKTIPQVAHTYAVLLSQLDWCYGAEMGANECGVVIGNEAVWTVVKEEETSPALLGMDLVRLGLERASTAEEALDYITELLEIHGQGGACAENDPDFTYHNSFLIADPHEAWILETAGRHWVAQHVTEGTRNISNGLTIRRDFQRHSKGLHDYAKQQGIWDGRGLLDWAVCFSEGGHSDLQSPRQDRGCQLLQERSSSSGPWMTAERMMEVLRDHNGGICMHGPGFETTASMVSVLRKDNFQHWLTGKPLPCKCQFHLHSVQEDSPTMK